jgi:hypothetical protein
MGESRDALDAEHALLVARLHRRSDDFEASIRLKAVLASLQEMNRTGIRGCS